MNPPACSPHPVRRARALLVSMTAMIFGLLVGDTRSAEPAANRPTVQLRILFANSLIQNVNRADVLAAFKLWIETVGHNRGYALEADPESYDRLDEVAKQLEEKTVDLVIFTTSEYLHFGEGGPLEPVFTPVRNQEALFDDYVLVTRRDRNLASLSALRGKSVVFYQHGANLGRQWLEVMLGESGLGSVKEFFGNKGDSTKISSAVLPVFFGKFDAGVVQRSGLDTMKEMNPQLGTQLQVLTQSPYLPESVICLHRDYPNIREDLLSALAELHNDPRGQQVLLVFKISRLVPFKPEFLDGVRDLQVRQNRLRPPTEREAAVAATAGAPRS